MNIDPLNSPGFVRQSLTNSANNEQTVRRPVDGGSDQLATALSSRVREMLASIPEVRPDVVERGRQLLADPNYPSFEIATEIARRISPLSEDEAGLTD
jgi:hypothetical protein